MVCRREVQLMPTLFLKLTKIKATEKRQIRLFQRPHSGLTTLLQEMYAPSLPVFPLEFRAEVNHKDTILQ